MDYTITLTQAENMALSYVTASQQDWIDNFVKHRCYIATEEIVKITVEKCLENNVQIPSSKDEIVALAFSNNWVKTAEQRIQESTDQ